jgi:Family of unknown function (DUF5317)
VCRPTDVHYRSSCGFGERGARRAVKNEGRTADEDLVLIGTALLLAALTVPLSGGRLSRLGELRMRSLWLVFLALALQVAIINVIPGGSPAPHRIVHLGSYALLAAFVIRNRHVPFLWLIALGGACNLAAISANGGVMPARAEALAAAGIRQDPASFINSTTVAHPHLQALGDVFAVPAGLPMSNVFSVGDVLIVLGALLALHRICGSRLASRRGARAEQALAERS